MSGKAIRTVVRALFSMTSRARAASQIRIALRKYLRLAARVDRKSGSQPVMVPEMRGIDEDMRNWSFFMILEHNTIVNRSITSIIQQLAREEESAGVGGIDFKRDVMPASNAGEDEIECFRRSMEEHLEIVSGLGPLRGTRTKDHPIFGPFDAHQWNCMFAFHLNLHYRQAQFVVSRVGHPDGSM
jgi:hypothetical protein